MCATCVAQGVAYLVPAYAVVKTSTRRRHRKRSDQGRPVDEPSPAASTEPAVSNA